MIKQIDDLTIPPTLSGNIEKFNMDKRQRTVGGRLITKTSSFEKWRVILNYEDRTMPLEQQRALYDKCHAMRAIARPVTFESPYDGREYTVNMVCTEPLPPKILMHRKGTPLHYSNIGATFEEV